MRGNSRDAAAQREGLGRGIFARQPARACFARRARRRQNCRDRRVRPGLQPQFSPQDARRKCFEDQLAVAAQLGKPAFLHGRGAFGDFLGILKKYRADLSGAVVHCLTGEMREPEAYLAPDCHIGITGWICDERRGTHLVPLVRQIPTDRLLLETDAPYLLPRNLPKSIRGKSGRNEPSLLPHIATFVAKIMGKTAEQLAAETTANASRLFNLPPSV